MSENTGITPEHAMTFTTGTRTITGPLPGIKRGDMIEVVHGDATLVVRVMEVRPEGRSVSLVTEPGSYDGEFAARKASSGPGWPLESPPPGHPHWDSAGREWVKADADGRQWIRAGDLWYPSFPETMGTPASDDAEV